MYVLLALSTSHCFKDGVAFTISFHGESVPPSEFEADSLEEKNKIFRMLTLIIEVNRKASKAEDVNVPQPSENLLKEGRLEKKGHSVAYFNWAMLVLSHHVQD